MSPIASLSSGPISQSVGTKVCPDCERPHLCLTARCGPCQRLYNAKRRAICARLFSEGIAQW